MDNKKQLKQQIQELFLSHGRTITDLMAIKWIKDLSEYKNEDVLYALKKMEYSNEMLTVQSVREIIDPDLNPNKKAKRVFKSVMRAAEKGQHAIEKLDGKLKEYICDTYGGFSKFKECDNSFVEKRLETDFIDDYIFIIDKKDKNKFIEQYNNALIDNKKQIG